MAQTAIARLVLFGFAIHLSCKAVVAISGTGSAGVVSKSSSGPALVPWLQPASWQPAYAGVTDIEALLKLRASPSNWATLYVFVLPYNATADSAETRAFLRLALNTFLSYRVYGQADNDIVACMNAPALDWCRRYRLPCADASAYAGDTRNLKRIGWAKFKLTRDLLKKGYHVHLSDLDVSYLKPVAPAVEEVFSWSNGVADGSMMQEEWVYQDNPNSTASRRPIYLANTGVVWLKANARSINFMESLLRFEGDSYQDQYIATHVAYQAWAPCQEEATCLSVASRGMAAITRHPAQFAHSNCEPEPRYDHCASRRLYVHAICRALNTDKEGFLRSVKAMFIKAAELGAGSSSGGVRMQDDPAAFGRHDVDIAAASGLPCPARGHAWSAHFYSAYTTQGSAVGAGPDGVGEAVSGTGAGAAAAATTSASAGAGAGSGSGSGADSEVVGTEAVAAHMDAESAKVRAQALSERTGGRPAHHSRKAHQRPHRHLMRLRS